MKDILDVIGSNRVAACYEKLADIIDAAGLESVTPEELRKIASDVRRDSKGSKANAK